MGVTRLPRGPQNMNKNPWSKGNKKGGCLHVPLARTKGISTHSTLGHLACNHLTSFSLCTSSLILPGDGWQLIDILSQYLEFIFIREDALIFLRNRKSTPTWTERKLSNLHEKSRCRAASEGSCKSFGSAPQTPCALPSLLCMLQPQADSKSTLMILVNVCRYYNVQGSIKVVSPCLLLGARKYFWKPSMMISFTSPCPRLDHIPISKPIIDKVTPILMISFWGWNGYCRLNL